MIPEPGNTGIPEGQGIWEHFTMRDGLPDMKIECLFEDSRGVLWIGTHDRGVVRYEGDEFRGYNRRDGLAGDGVFSIIEDREGNLWFGTNQGLTRYDGSKFEILGLEEPCSFLWGSCTDQEGVLWFGLERKPGRPPTLCRWDGEQLELVQVTDRAEPAGESIHKIITDDQGGLWLGGDYLYRRVGETSFEQLEIPTSEVGAIQDFLSWTDGSLWIATESELWKYDGERFGRLLDERAGHGPVSLLRDPSGFCWITTYDGRLLCYDGATFRLIHNLNTVMRGGLCRDKVGRLWIGTYGMGLYYYDSTRVKVFRTEQGLPAGPVECLAEDVEGTLWIGTRNGLVGYVGAHPSVVKRKKEFDEIEITGLLVDSVDRLWASTRGGYLYACDGDNIQQYPTVPEMEGYRIIGLSEDRHGRIWFGSRYGKGFGYWDNGEITCFSSEKEDYPTWIGALMVDRQGHVWLGSASPAAWDGLCRFDGVSFERISGISGSPILALCEAEDGGFWVGTNEGISGYDGECFTAFTQEDGLSCEIVTAIIQDGDGTLWIGTEGGGVCCYDGKIFQVIQIPGEPECNVIHAIHQDHRGRLWWGTEGGLVQYTPRCIKPEVEITEVIADGSYPEPTEVQFSTSVGRVSFRFRGRSQQEHSSYLVYRYRLHGYEEDWRQTRDRQAEYPQLKPGDYVFTVQVVDRDLNYSETVEIKLFVIEDPRIEALTEALSSETIKGEFIGESVALKEVKKQLQEVAWTDLTVLVLGETGTGKGLAARAIHELSERRVRPFIHVNCGGLQRDLVDSDLFGHERGAFTGAHSRKLGKFELADGGTIFLDEIGDLPLESQTKLLHVLQERSIERVGGTRTISVDVRVIAATNRNLNKAIREEIFRADLYYRLNVIPVQIPPLRERKEDIPLLTRHFVRQFAAHLHQNPPFIREEAIKLLSGYDWPGNVRELEHTLQRAVIFAEETGIGPEHIVLAPASSTDFRGEEFAILPLEEYDRRYLIKVLEHTGGVIHGKRGAALLLGMKPTTLRSRLEKLGVEIKRAR